MSGACFYFHTEDRGEFKVSAKIDKTNDLTKDYPVIKIDSEAGEFCLFPSIEQAKMLYLELEKMLYDWDHRRELEKSRETIPYDPDLPF